MKPNLIPTCVRIGANPTRPGIPAPSAVILPKDRYHLVQGRIGRIMQQCKRVNCIGPKRLFQHRFLGRRTGRQQMALADAEGRSGHTQAMVQRPAGIGTVMNLGRGQLLRPFRETPQHAKVILLEMQGGRAGQFLDPVHIFPAGRQQLPCRQNRERPWHSRGGRRRTCIDRKIYRRGAPSTEKKFAKFANNNFKHVVPTQGDV